jgi:MFS family permease
MTVARPPGTALPIYGFFVLGVFSGHAVYLPELFPTHVRATAVSFCNGTGRIITSTGPLVAGLLVGYFGRFTTPAAIMTGFAAPEAGRTLRQAADFFGSGGPSRQIRSRQRAFPWSSRRVPDVEDFNGVVDSSIKNLVSIASNDFNAHARIIRSF